MGTVELANKAFVDITGEEFCNAQIATVKWNALTELREEGAVRACLSEELSEFKDVFKLHFLSIIVDSNSQNINALTDELNKKLTDFKEKHRDGVVALINYDDKGNSQELVRLCFEKGIKVFEIVQAKDMNKIEMEEQSLSQVSLLVISDDTPNNVVKKVADSVLVLMDFDGESDNLFFSVKRDSNR